MNDLRTLLHALADAVADRFEQPFDATEYYDQESSPLPSATHCRLVRRGAIEGFKVHGRVLVRRAEMHRYIESHKVEPLPAADEPQSKDKAVASALANLGLKGGNRAA